MKPFDWNAAAVRMADKIHEEMFSAHRGAMPWLTSGVSVIFGNDGYGPPGDEDGRSRLQVEMIRTYLAEKGIGVLGFGVDTEGEDYTWVLLVSSDDVETLNTLAWMAWEAACGNRDGIEGAPEAKFARGVQADIAAGVIASHAPTDRLSLN